jgi:NAD(P)-dependent dehydrogenase (short-subunit alcohol dehydrogenase family)
MQGVAPRSAGLVPLSYAEYVLRATAAAAAGGVAGISPSSVEAAAAAAAAAVHVSASAANAGPAAAPSRTTSSILGELAPPVPADACRFIVCVSAMEGRFFRSKMPTHPHTNMAKAALNMMVRTSAADYAKECVLSSSEVLACTPPPHSSPSQSNLHDRCGHWVADA